MDIPIQWKSSLIGGGMRAADFTNYMAQAQLDNSLSFLPPVFRAAQIRVNTVDANGGIIDFIIVDPGRAIHIHQK